MSRVLRRSVAFAAAALIVVLAASLVLGKGQLLGGKLRTGDTVTVPADETWDGDLYLLGGRVSVAGSVDGDLTVLGGQVDVGGSVTGDVLAAGGNVSIAGDPNYAAMYGSRAGRSTSAGRCTRTWQSPVARSQSRRAARSVAT